MLQELKKKVKKKVNVQAFQSILSYVRARKVVLWGQWQPKDYLETYLILVLAKDLLHKSYDWIVKNVQYKPAISSTTLQENCHRLRYILQDWGR